MSSSLNVFVGKWGPISVSEYISLGPKPAFICFSLANSWPNWPVARRKPRFDTWRNFSSSGTYFPWSQKFRGGQIRRLFPEMSTPRLLQKTVKTSKKFNFIFEKLWNFAISLLRWEKNWGKKQAKELFPLPLPISFS